MKKVFCLLCAVLWISFFGLAQAPGEPAEEGEIQPLEVKTFVGKVGLVYLGDSYEDELRRIEVVDEIGQRLSFNVEKDKTKITGKDGKKLSLGEINKEDKVIIEYTQDKKNRKAALSIKVSE
ncbi:MAG: hypothetical protein AMJ95_06550 [Omnitrophica WOR_2 bacterium SM23_72]|nr:MAG: hypothetical protein AMJ95_06550 [Omnitrophica WOR_2 bacterium SM23_72]